MKKLILIVLVLLLNAMSNAATVGTGLDCTPPTAYIDGSPIQDPVTYKFYCRANDAAPYAAGDLLSSSAVCSTSFSSASLSDGVKKCAVTATVLGVESDFTQDVRMLAKGGTIYLIAPNAPTGLRIMSK